MTPLRGISLLLAALPVPGTWTEAFIPRQTSSLQHHQQSYHDDLLCRRCFSSLRMSCEDNEVDSEKGDNGESEIPNAGVSSASEPNSADTKKEERKVPAYWKRTDVVNDESKVNSALGLGRGAVLLTIAILINIWFFSIPTEFRRTRLCNEFDTQAYPELCMTPKMFVDGIADYYKSGTLKSG